MGDEPYVDSQSHSPLSSVVRCSSVLKGDEKRFLRADKEARCRKDENNVSVQLDVIVGASTASTTLLELQCVLGVVKAFINSPLQAPRVVNSTVLPPTTCLPTYLPYLHIRRLILFCNSLASDYP